jgi:hypothetical protein
VERNIVKTLSMATWAFVLVLFGTLASSSAMAQHRGHGGGNGRSGGYSQSGGYGHGGGYARVGGYGRGYGGGARFGISLGLPIYAPGYYPAPYYSYPAYGYAPYPYPAPAYAYPPAVAGYSPSPPVYAERGVAQAAPAPSQAQGDWYYCAESGGYYPDISECFAGWQRVPAQPPSR